MLTCSYFIQIQLHITMPPRYPCIVFSHFFNKNKLVVCTCAKRHQSIRPSLRTPKYNTYCIKFSRLKYKPLTQPQSAPASLPTSASHLCIHMSFQQEPWHTTGRHPPSLTDPFSRDTTSSKVGYPTDITHTGSFVETSAFLSFKAVMAALH